MSTYYVTRAAEEHGKRVLNLKSPERNDVMQAIVDFDEYSEQTRLMNEHQVAAGKPVFRKPKIYKDELEIGEAQLRKDGGAAT